MLICVSKVRSQPKGATFIAGLWYAILGLVSFGASGLWGIFILECVFETDSSWQWTILLITVSLGSDVGVVLPAVSFRWKVM